MRWGTVLLIGLLALVLLWGNLGGFSQAIEREPLRRALLSTVRIAVPIDGQEDLYSTGSGSVLTADGYILTNYHVMGDTDEETLYNEEGIAYVAVNPTDLRSLPIWIYEAKIVRGDPNLDLAVIQVTGMLDQGASLPNPLNMLTMPIGDSDLVEIGDELSAVGFPSIGGNSVTFTSGRVSGFEDEDEDGLIDWIKTDAEINKGNSGGAAINEMGELIGVPTLISFEGAGQLGLVRPINRAEPIIKAALQGVTATVETTHTARITSLIFSDQVEQLPGRAGWRAGPASTRFAPDTETIYAVFDFEGFQDGLEFEVEWTLNGEPALTDRWNWNEGERGTTWVSIAYQNRNFPEGIFELTLSLEGVPLRSGRIVVGDAELPTEEPTFTTPRFASQVTEDNKPVDLHEAGEPFPSGTTALYGFFDYSGMQDGMTWSRHWYLDGEIVTERELTWQFGASGSLWVSIYSEEALPDGEYRLELRIEGETVAEAETRIGEGDSPIIEDTGVQAIGTITDADTGRAVRGAFIYVLKPGISPRAFLIRPRQQDIHAAGESDRQGRFVLSQPLQRGETYAIVAGAEGYQPMLQNRYTVAEDAISPIEFDIQLQRR